MQRWAIQRWVRVWQHLVAGVDGQGLVADGSAVPEGLHEVLQVGLVMRPHVPIPPTISSSDGLKRYPACQITRMLTGDMLTRQVISLQAFLALRAMAAAGNAVCSSKPASRGCSCELLLFAAGRGVFGTRQDVMRGLCYLGSVCSLSLSLRHRRPVCVELAAAGCMERAACRAPG